MKILVAVPTFENITPETFKAIYDLHTGDHTVDFDFVKGYDCAVARNKIVDKTLKGGYDAVLMVDSDVIIPEDTLERFLESPVPICFGLCPRKNTDKRLTTAYKLGTANYDNAYSYDELNLSRLECRGVGAACVLIRREVFEAMKYPYFKYVTYDDGRLLSEDFYFCEEARNRGYVIWADTRVRCGHLTRGFQYE